jgi:hypothetical protein
MGYRTYYKIQIFHPELGWENLLNYTPSEYKDLHMLKEAYIPRNVERCLIPLFKYVYENLGGDNWRGFYEDSQKWYDHEAELLNLSLAVPNMGIQLSGEGEESGDIWRKRFVNGKMYATQVIIQYEPWPQEALIDGE